MRISGTYFGLSFCVSHWDPEKEGRLREVFERYLPGLRLDDGLAARERYCVLLDYGICDPGSSEAGEWVGVSPEGVSARVSARGFHEFLVLGVLTTAFEFVLQHLGVYFLHGAAGLRDGGAVVFWGRRADGKSTLVREMPIQGFAGVHDDRIALVDEGGPADSRGVPSVRASHVACLLTPKVLRMGDVAFWPLTPHSLRYELFCEASERIRAAGTLEGEVVLPSIDTPALCAKRMAFVSRLASLLSGHAFFVEGTPAEILRFAARVSRETTGCRPTSR